jgi:hypothetical protein
VWKKVNDNGGSSDSAIDVATTSKDAVYLYNRACPIGGHFRKKFRTGFFASGDRDDIFQK